ncbi:hypothetical protein GGI15_003844 [Coemansia interrupta]|uniref:Uncharacterized protein n=1 Tax=Coemansia interrupta TaxID=1126814 RepID=A0A9W8H905_9FUNG|nr:hypothetical protein GGI15_003844 [Coemansia interrupta]
MYSGFVIVSGASQGIGRLVSLYLLEHYPQVSVVAISRSELLLKTLKDESEAFGLNRLHVVAGDIAKQETQDTAIALVPENQPLLAVINNAAQCQPNCHILDVTHNQWTRILDTNLLAPMNLLSKCLPMLCASQGRVINITSSTSQGPVPAFGAYGVTKVALNYVSAAMAIEYPDITTIAFYPGVVETAMNGVALAAVQTYAADPRTVKAGVDVSRVIAKLEAPIPADAPCAMIANLAMNADRALSGKFITVDSSEAEKYKTPTAQN